MKFALPAAARVRGDVVRACCGMISSDSSLKDISKRERIISQIFAEVAQAAQPCPEMRGDAHEGTMLYRLKTVRK